MKLFAKILLALLLGGLAAALAAPQPQLSGNGWTEKGELSVLFIGPDDTLRGAL